MPTVKISGGDENHLEIRGHGAYLEYSGLFFSGERRESALSNEA